MAKNNKLKKIKGRLVLIITLGLLAFFAYSILYNGGVVVKRTDSTEVINKLTLIKIKGGEFELTQKDIDELSNLYIAKPISKGDMLLQGVNLEMLNDQLLIEAPISYNNLNLLLTSKGKINFSNGEISYVADNFKIGKVTLPKSLVISQLKKQNSKFFYVEDNLIKIKESALPIKIQELKIADNKMLGVAEKPDIKELIEDFSNSSIEEKKKVLNDILNIFEKATSD